MVSITAELNSGLDEERPELERSLAMCGSRQVIGRLDRTALGARRGGGTVRIARSDPAGCLLYGPYWQLPEGHYRLSFQCQARRPRLLSQPVLGVEVIVANRVQQAWRDFTIEELRTGTGAIVFEVPPELNLEGRNDARFEFKFYHLGNADLRISGGDLSRLPQGEPPPVAPRAWRMLGRLQKSLIGRRASDGSITVRRGTRAGCLLYGGWPYLRLPAGRYRLSVDCRPGSARVPSQPVLGIEVIGQSRWRSNRPWQWRSWVYPPLRGVRLARCDITAGELLAGSGSIDFEVPTGLGLDQDEDAPFEFKLFHLGNADLTITAVNLEARSEPVSPLTLDPSTPASPLPVLNRTNIVVIGNCQADSVCQVFNLAVPLNRSFKAKFHFVGLPKYLHEAGKSDLRKCDILLVQDNKSWEDYPLRPDIRQDVPIVKFPQIRFASLWPFDFWNGPSDREAYEREQPNLTFPHLDGLLGRMRKEIPDRERRFLAYRSLDIPGIVNYLRLHDFERRRLIALDKQFGCDIGRFILDNFQKKRIFYSTVRPNAQLLNMLVRHVLKSIGVKPAYSVPDTVDHTLRSLQIPVHPKIAGGLKVTWADENTRYAYRNEEITWEMYIRRYIDHYG